MHEEVLGYRSLDGEPVPVCRECMVEWEPHCYACGHPAQEGDGPYGHGLPSYDKPDCHECEECEHEL